MVLRRDPRITAKSVGDPPQSRIYIGAKAGVNLQRLLPWVATGSTCRAWVAWRSWMASPAVLAERRDVPHVHVVIVIVVLLAMPARQDVLIVAAVVRGPRLGLGLVDRVVDGLARGVASLVGGVHSEAVLARRTGVDPI